MKGFLEIHDDEDKREVEHFWAIDDTTKNMYLLNATSSSTKSSLVVP